jgi:hypothetical protein
MITLAATAAAAAGFAGLPAPAEAQQNSIAEIIVYGTDPCPRSTDDQIVVCRRVPESYRYRLPEAYRPGGTRQESDSWANKAKVIETVGATGINSCSPVGPGGYTGCLTRVIKEAREQRKQSAEDTIPPQ